MATVTFKDENFHLMLVANREETFKNWGFDDNSPCSAKKMAEAGFFHVSGDAVQCFVCLKELEGWEQNDDPRKEHAAHTVERGRACEFLKLGKSEEEITMAEFLRLCKARHKNLMKRNGEAIIKEFEENALQVLTRLENMTV